MKKIDKGHKFCLIGKIKGLAEEARLIRRKMRSAENETQYYGMRYIKNSIRADARYHALAYAYLKGVAYNVLERKCNEKPNPETILKIVMLHSHLSSFTFYKDNIANIKDWLDGKRDAVK